MKKWIIILILSMFSYCILYASDSIRISYTDLVTNQTIGETLLNDAEVKALLGDMSDIKSWTNNTIKNKARQMVDLYVTRSGQGSEYTPLEQKYDIIRNITIETAKDRELKILNKVKK